MQKFISYTAFVISISVLIALVVTGLDFEFWEVVNAIAAVISGLAASLGLLFVGFQLRSTDRLSKAQFINDLARDIDLHIRAESNLDRGGKWYENTNVLEIEDVEAIEKYLNFFERIQLILDTKVLDLEIIDKLFAYRFFYLVHNPNVQSKVLLNSDMQPYFCSFFELYFTWLKYRHNRGLSIPHEKLIIEKSKVIFDAGTSN